MEQLVIVLIFGAVAFFNWLIKKAQESQQNQDNSHESTPDISRKHAPPRTPSARRSAPESEEERLRKFMEALGIPKDAMPIPKKVEPKPPVFKAEPVVVLPKQIAPKPIQAQKPAPKAEVPKTEVFHPSLKQPMEKETPVLVEKEKDAYGVSTQDPKSPARLNKLRHLLKNPDSIRTAVMLREILGSPKGL